MYIKYGYVARFMFDILFSQFQYHIVSEDPVKMAKPLLEEKIGYYNNNGNLVYKPVALITNK